MADKSPRKQPQARKLSTKEKKARKNAKVAAKKDAALKVLSTMAR